MFLLCLLFHAYTYTYKYVTFIVKFIAYFSCIRVCYFFALFSMLLYLTLAIDKVDYCWLLISAGRSFKGAIEARACFRERDCSFYIFQRPKNAFFSKNPVLSVLARFLRNTDCKQNTLWPEPIYYLVLCFWRSLTERKVNGLNVVLVWHFPSWLFSVHNI